MARAARLSEQESPQGQSPEPQACPQKQGTPREQKSPPELWADGLGRVGVRSAQILLILTVVVVSVFALLQIRLLVIPVLIALVLAAAIVPFVNLLKRRGLPGAAATGLAFVALLAVLSGVTTVIVVSIRSQWSELVSQASSGLDELQSFLLNGPIPVDREQIEQARAAIVEFAASSQVRSGALTGLSVITEFLAGASLVVVILFFFLKDGTSIWNFFLQPFTGAREAKCAGLVPGPSRSWVTTCAARPLLPWWTPWPSARRC